MDAPAKKQRVEEPSESEGDVEVVEVDPPQDTPTAPSAGMQLWWTAETSTHMSVILIRNPVVNCKLSTPTSKAVEIAWTAQLPKSDPLKHIAGGLKLAFRELDVHRGTLQLPVKNGELQQNQRDWDKKITTEYAIIKIPKVSAIEETSTEL